MDRRLIRSPMVVGSILVVVLIVFLLWYKIHEPWKWAEAYRQIENGMSLEEVEMVFDPLEPRRKWTSKINPATRRDFEPEEARSQIDYLAPNAWQYRVYFNEAGKVVKKLHWWD